MNKKMIEGLTNASPEKRNKSFLTTAADKESVWMIAVEGDAISITLGEKEGIPVWPEKVFCENFLKEAHLESSGIEILEVDVHDFMDLCDELEESTTFFVFPTRKNTYVCDRDSLCGQLQKYLDEWKIEGRLFGDKPNDLPLIKMIA